VGVIELGFSKTINLFYAQWGCPGKTYYADLRMDLEADLAMDATYAYYLSATFIPPSKPETFAYFGMEPQAYIGLHIEGNAQMQTPSVRKKIVDTLSYPGLAVKGIAAVGPTLDIYGEVIPHYIPIARIVSDLAHRFGVKSPYTGSLMQEQWLHSERPRSTGLRMMRLRRNMDPYSELRVTPRHQLLEVLSRFSMQESPSMHS
jgi:hypothetical protein